MADADPTIDSECWKPVTFHPFSGYYEVSNRGRVRRYRGWRYSRSGNFLRPGITKAGYPLVVLSAEGARKSFAVHILVAEAFLSQRPDGFETNHKDGNKTNNLVENLEYVTVRENARHAWRHGLCYWKGEQSPKAKLTESQVLWILSAHSAGTHTIRELALCFGVCRWTISLIVKRRNWKYLQPA